MNWFGGITWDDSMDHSVAVQQLNSALRIKNVECSVNWDKEGVNIKLSPSRAIQLATLLNGKNA